LFYQKLFTIFIQIGYKMEISFLGGDSPGRSVSVSSEETINFYPEITKASDKSNIVLIGTPGKIKYTSISGYGAIRRLYASSQGRLFCVVGNRFIEIIDALTSKTISTLDTNTGSISIAENNFELMLCDGTSGYIYNINSTAFVKITSSDYSVGNSVISVNGRFIQNKINSSEFIFSAYQDGLTWDSLDYATTEISSDNIDAVSTANNELIFFGKKSIEIWYNHAPSAIGITDIYSRVNNVFINIGIAAPQSVGTINNTVFWLGSNLEGNNIVWMLKGYQPVRISDHSMEYLIGQLTNTSDAIGYCYQQEGHEFYVLTFISDNKTIVYDLTTGLWHQRGYWNKTNGLNDADRGLCCVFWNGKNYIGDYQNGNIYEISLDCFTDDGNIIMRRRTGGHIHSDRQRLFFREFEIDLERGVGLITGQGINPQACLTWSDDGGFTWSNEYWGTPGEIGNYKTRLHWHRLGYSRDRVFRVTVSDPVKWVLIGARADIEKERP
jgi:hypothetical protein